MRVALRNEESGRRLYRFNAPRVARIDGGIYVAWEHMKEKPHVPSLHERADEDEATRVDAPDSKILAQSRRSDRKIPVDGPAESQHSQPKLTPPLPPSQPEGSEGRGSS
jgi:hypothetical protein